VIEDEPRNARAMNDLGVVLLQGGETAEAQGFLRAAFALHPAEEIRRNLRAAADRTGSPPIDAEQEPGFRLKRRDDGVYALVAP
jgi:hypothetical protein